MAFIIFQSFVIKSFKQGKIKLGKIVYLGIGDLIFYAVIGTIRNNSYRFLNLVGLAYKIKCFPCLFSLHLKLYCYEFEKLFFVVIHLKAYQKHVFPVLTSDIILIYP